MDPRFHAPRADHSPPEALGDEELASAVDSLRRKLHSARRARAGSRAVGVAMGVAFLIIAFTLLWAGPASFIERLLGERAFATPWDIVLWWVLIIVLVVAGGAFTDQALRGRFRRARGWSEKVHDLEHRLAAAEAERDRRTRAP